MSHKSCPTFGEARKIDNYEELKALLSIKVNKYTIDIEDVLGMYEGMILNPLIDDSFFDVMEQFVEQFQLTRFFASIVDHKECSNERKLRILQHKDQSNKLCRILSSNREIDDEIFDLVFQTNIQNIDWLAMLYLSADNRFKSYTGTLLGLDNEKYGLIAVGLSNGNYSLDFIKDYVSKKDGLDKYIDNFMPIFIKTLDSVNQEKLDFIISKEKIEYMCYLVTSISFRKKAINENILNHIADYYINNIENYHDDNVRKMVVSSLDIIIQYSCLHKDSKKITILFDLLMKLSRNYDKRSGSLTNTVILLVQKNTAPTGLLNYIEAHLGYFLAKEKERIKELLFQHPNYRSMAQCLLANIQTA